MEDRIREEYARFKSCFALFSKAHGVFETAENVLLKVAQDLSGLMTCLGRYVAYLITLNLRYTYLMNLLKLLEELLKSPEWSHIGHVWDKKTREKVNLVWHRLNGTLSQQSAHNSNTSLLGWPDATEGLHALKKHKLIATLSNGNVRLLVDMVCI